jgi:hypothetical protein
VRNQLRPYSKQPSIPSTAYIKPSLTTYVYCTALQAQVVSLEATPALYLATTSPVTIEFTVSDWSTFCDGV